MEGWEHVIENCFATAARESRTKKAPVCGVLLKMQCNRKRNK